MKHKLMIAATLMAGIFLLLSTSEAIVIKDHVMTKDNKADTSCETPIPSYSFNTADDRIYSWLLIDNVVFMDKISWMWYRPDNVLQQEFVDIFPAPDNCAWSWLDMYEAEDHPGNWYIDVYVNDVYEFTESFTVSPENPCAAKAIHGEHSKETELLRFFRDSVLSQTPEGQELIKLYYQWSPVIVEVIEEDEAFKEELKEMIDGVLVLIKGEVR